MGNIITNTSSLTTSLDLADGNAKVKKDLSVAGKSTFTGDSLFNGNLSVTNGKFNSVDVSAMNTDVTKLKTDVTTLSTTVDSVKAGSFEGKSISGATDVTATGTGTFKTVKTTDIDINGDILSSTGKKYIITNAASGLSMTNGLTDATKINSLTLKADGLIQVTSAPQQNVKINEMTISRIENAFAKGTYLTSLNGLSGITTGRLTANESITVNDTVNTKSMKASGLVTCTGGITTTTLTATGDSVLEDVKASGTISADGGLTASTLTTSGASTLKGDLNAKNVIIGTNKWVIEEVADTTKGTRLCFGKADAQGVKTYWTCMNNTGNLELF